MAVLSEAARVLYVVVPKAACTSLKTTFRQLAGDPPRPGVVARLLGRAPVRRSVHQVAGYRTLPFESVTPPPARYEKITAVRDPIARLQSAWSNKVCASAFAARGEIEAIRAQGLSIDPSFAEFLENIETYRAISVPAQAHTRPFVWHLGPDLGWYDHVFRIEQMPTLEAYLSSRVGRPITVPRENRSDSSARPLDFEARHVDLLRRLLADDYRLLDGLYSFDEGLETFTRRHAVALPLSA